MPIRLTTAYAERLASDRFEAGSPPRKDLASLCQFWRKLLDTDSPNSSLLKSQFLRLVQESRSASARLLGGDHSLLQFAALKTYERFALAFLSAVVISCIEALDVAIAEATKSGEKNRKEGIAAQDKTSAENALRDKVDNLGNIQISFLIGASPRSYVTDFMQHACNLGVEILVSKGLESESNVMLSHNCLKSAQELLEVWLTSDNPSATWVLNYLNFQHQAASSERVLDNVTTLAQAFPNWLQPTTDAAKKRADAWNKYRKWLGGLPDHNETMFAEKFGVRKVFVQPVARYKVAGMGTDAGAKVSDVANLIAGLISERIPGDELILLCGGPGSGKSTLCRIMASELASNPEIHPVFLRLRRLQDTQEISNFIEIQLQKEGVIDRLDDLEQISNLVLILDGFDELVMATKSRLREFFSRLRDDLISRPLRSAKAIVSGRDTLFPNGAGLPIGSHVISLLPFDKPRIAAWGEKWRSSVDNAKNFEPEVFYDEQAETKGKSSPLHHLVSWPLTLHLVARVHSLGGLDLNKAKKQAVEKAILYRSIVAESAARQQEQVAGEGRLTPEQMRAFIQAISWEMYSTSRDALDYSEGLPLLKKIRENISEADLSDLAEVAIVSQPELTKGEEGGFEFVHKSFSEYFIAERFAHTVERVCFKSQDYKDELNWRMSVKEALGELSTILSIRLVPAEIQEMLEPMLPSFREFSRPGANGKSRASDLADKLATKKVRFEQLIAEYASGQYQNDIVDSVKESRIVKNERDIHANFTVGLLVLGCAVSNRLSNFRPANKEQLVEALEVSDSRLWKLISITQAGDIQFDLGLAARCLSPLRIGPDNNPVSVLYPPIPARFLQGLRGARFPVEDAVYSLIDMVSALQMERVVSPLIRALEFGSDGLRPGIEPFQHHRGRTHLSFDEGWTRELPEIASVFERSGLIREGEFQDLHYSLRRMDEPLYRLRRLSEMGKLGKQQLDEIFDLVREGAYRLGRRRGSYFFRETIERFEYLFHEYKNRD